MSLAVLYTTWTIEVRLSEEVGTDCVVSMDDWATTNSLRSKVSQRVSSAGLVLLNTMHIAGHLKVTERMWQDFLDSGELLVSL